MAALEEAGLGDLMAEPILDAPSPQLRALKEASSFSQSFQYSFTADHSMSFSGAMGGEGPREPLGLQGQDSAHDLSGDTSHALPHLAPQGSLINRSALNLPRQRRVPKAPKDIRTDVSSRMLQTLLPTLSFSLLGLCVKSRQLGGRLAWEKDMPPFSVNSD